MEASEQILEAIKESGGRQEKALNSLAEEIRDLSKSIVKGFSAERITQPGGNGGMYGIIATFATVIISLGAIFFSQQQSQRDMMLVLDDHNKERILQLDEKLQIEVLKAKAEVEAQFTQVGVEARQQHVAQQTLIEDIKGWFGAPQLRNNPQ